MMKDMIHYSDLIDEAMRVIVFKILKKVENSGLPGHHHFFISFVTKHEGVRIAETLKAKYPHTMTIVLQHQYKNLEVDGKGFAITLSFGNKEEDLYIPFSSIVVFNDPSAQFTFHFQYASSSDTRNTLLEGVSIFDYSKQKSTIAVHHQNRPSKPDNVIAFSQLRKKR